MSNMLTLHEKTIEDFLKSGVESPFIIPDYQRAYEWPKKDADALFDDLMDFTLNVSSECKEAKYFLGTIVLYVNKEDKTREIIDGQQRIVSLMMLLRAMHKTLSDQSASSNRTKNLLGKIAPTIWVTDDIEGTVDYTKQFISSESIDEKHKCDLHSILETGKISRKISGCYKINYKHFLDNYEKLYKDEQKTAEKLILCLLKQTIVFVIELDNRDTALTMFSTLNYRGKSLSEVNIFRAEIYKRKPEPEKKSFNALWNRLFKNIDSQLKMSAKDIFRQYMFYLLAKDKYVESTVPGVGQYFTKEKSKRLRDESLLTNIASIIKFWTAIKKHKKIEGESWSEDFETLKIFDVLLSSELKNWRHSVIVYYLKHRDEFDFRENFRLFMRKLFSKYLPTCMLNSDITFVRENLLHLNAEIINSNRPKFDFKKPIDNHQLKKFMISSKYYRRTLLKCIAYTHPEQTELLLEKFDVEHIIPQKWYETYTARGYTKEKFSEYVEQLGNFTLLEPKKNKKSSNNQFNIKKTTYAQSSIAMTRELASEPDEWTPDSIAIRGNRIAESLIDRWRRWSDEYDRRA